MNNNNVVAAWSWNPVSDFREDFDRLFSAWSTPAVRSLKTEAQFTPACDVEEQEDHYLLTLEMAGVKKEDIQLDVIDRQIIISGERRQESQRKSTGQTYSERRFGRFQRSFTLPAGVDVEKIEANYQDGILGVMIPKAESAKPRQIKITTGSGGSKLFGKLLSPKETKDEAHTPNNHSKEKVAS